MTDVAEEVFDLDVVRASFIEEHPLEYRKLKLYDRVWRVRNEPNVAILLALADGGGVKGQMGFILGYIHADERDAFQEALESDEHFGTEMLERLTDFFAGESTGRPSEPSSTSVGSSSTDGQNSTDASSSTVETASTPSPSAAP